MTDDLPQTSHFPPILSFFLLFQDRFLWVALAILEVLLYTRLGLNSEILLLLPPVSAGIKGMQHHHPAGFIALVVI